jgi:hypothetical protein
MYKRSIESLINRNLFKGKIIIIYGPRQVGKTTLIRQIQKNHEGYLSLYLNCDEPDIREILTNASSTRLQSLIGRNRLILIDEAQRVCNIGLTLKLFADHFPDIQVIATGSSSLDLSNKITEPLTGRTFTLLLLPLSLKEMTQTHSALELKRILEEKMIHGLYPEVVTHAHESSVLLRHLSSGYLYKDVLQYQDIRKSDLIEKLLKAVALQIGQEVSFNELGSMLGVSKITVNHYIHLLEQCFILYRLTPFSRNLRNELTRKCKIYFYDNGIRNALINNFNLLSIRSDTGALWENFILTERIKYLNNSSRYVNRYFWRTHQQQEIDYIEESGGQIRAYEFKWDRDKHRVPKVFTDAYPEAVIEMVNRHNFEPFTGLNDDR